MNHDQPTPVVMVVPLYNPPTDFATNLERNKLQFDHVIVVDDGSPTPVDELGFEESDIIFIKLSDNVGIAAALNAGIRRGIDMFGEQSIFVTLDQDTVLPDTYVRSAMDRLSADSRRIGAVAAGAINGWRIPIERSGGFTLEPLQSGMTFCGVVWKAIGGFDEELFIDGVDEDFCLRLLAIGLITAPLDGLAVQHELGESRDIHILGRRVLISVHSSLRTHYIVRNRIVLTRRYARLQPRWAIRKLVKELKVLFLNFIVVDDRRGLYLAVSAGVRDGISGKMGRIQR